MTENVIYLKLVTGYNSEMRAREKVTYFFRVRGTCFNYFSCFVIISGPIFLPWHVEKFWLCNFLFYIFVIFQMK